MKNMSTGNEKSIVEKGIPYGLHFKRSDSMSQAFFYALWGFELPGIQNAEVLVRV